MHPFILYQGHTFIQWIMSFMIQIQQIFDVFMPHKRGTLPTVPGRYQWRIRELYSLVQWFMNHPICRTTPPVIGGRC